MKLAKKEELLKRILTLKSKGVTVSFQGFEEDDARHMGRRIEYSAGVHFDESECFLLFKIGRQDYEELAKHIIDCENLLSKFIELKEYRKQSPILIEYLKNNLS